MILQIARILSCMYCTCIKLTMYLYSHPLGILSVAIYFAVNWYLTNTTIFEMLIIVRITYWYLDISPVLVYALMSCNCIHTCLLVSLPRPPDGLKWYWSLLSERSLPQTASSSWTPIKPMNISEIYFRLVAVELKKEGVSALRRIYFTVSVSICCLSQQIHSFILSVYYEYILLPDGW